jgi:hypothetical protein
MEKNQPTQPHQFKMVNENHKFKFKNLCPYCKGNLTYEANGWEQDDNGLWMADSFDMECSTEPEMGSQEWEDWLSNHSEHPYIYQLPVDERVKEHINENYRFKIEDDKIHITEHAYDRAKSRLKWSADSLKRAAEKAHQSGIMHSQTKSHLNKYITSLWFKYKKCNNIRIHGEVIFFFKNNILITVYQLPHNLKKQLKYCKK